MASTSNTNDKALQFTSSSMNQEDESSDEDDFRLPSFLNTAQQDASSSSGKDTYLMNRHKTSPNILMTTSLDPSDGCQQRFVSSVNLPAKSAPRKSFLGDLFNRLTFKKKLDAEEVNINQNENSSNDGGTKVNESSAHVRGRRRADFFGNQTSDIDNHVEMTDMPKLQKTTNTVNTLQMSIKKWKLMKATEQKRETIAVNEDHQRVLDEAIERFQTEVPHPLQIVIKEEALRVVMKTMNMYKSMLGSKHELTQQATQHIAQLKVSLYGPSN